VPYWEAARERKLAGIREARSWAPVVQRVLWRLGLLGVLPHILSGCDLLKRALGGSTLESCSGIELVLGKPQTNART